MADGTDIVNKPAEKVKVKPMLKLKSGNKDIIEKINELDSGVMHFLDKILPHKLSCYYILHVPLYTGSTMREWYSWKFFFMFCHCLGKELLTYNLACLRMFPLRGPDLLVAALLPLAEGVWQHGRLTQCDRLFTIGVVYVAHA